ncbi:GNAT family N-acetyltransferase [Roseibacterium sp. SDUM158016]|uniref:GNAT family N-acetyltransferase n=1 Tax=Roseicyclus sediminis TaxID=2980997 RepID=UPI0021CE3271|nr:GNAT family N-acetyltransferase [Roseibacterium sp. SDUM158016]MCU4654055.1 GNAT family N-acetyltransferase [Roseibacterium sp. SDUM158016]
MDYVLKTAEALEDIPDHADFEALRREWFEVGTRDLAALGGPVRTVDQMMERFWEETQDFLAPNGVTVLALDGNGALLGSGALRRIGPGVADLKRLYVRPAARGMRLGQALAQERIDAARERGFKTLFTNTITSNHRMLGIYEGLGFSRVPRFPECHEPIEMDHLLIYLRLDL